MTPVPPVGEEARYAELERKYSASDWEMLQGEIPSEDLECLVSHGTPKVYESLIRIRSLPESVISIMYARMNDWLRDGVDNDTRFDLNLIYCDIGCHRNTPMDILETFLTGKDGDLAYFAAVNPKMPIERVYDLLGRLNYGDDYDRKIFANLSQAIKERECVTQKVKKPSEP